MRIHLLRSLALVAGLTFASGCTAVRGAGSHPVPVRSIHGDVRLVPRAIERPEVRVEPDEPATNTKGRLLPMRQMIRRTFTPLVFTLSLLAAAPLYAVEQLEAQRQESPIVRRRAPQGQRRQALAFVRTELFFGTAKPVGAVTPEEFERFLDEVVTPLFPDGLTVTKADGQFRGADGVTIKEDSYVLVLLYPLDTQKVSNRSIETIRAAYLQQHQQESVLRVDDPFLVWVSF